MQPKGHAPPKPWTIGILADGLRDDYPNKVLYGAASELRPLGGSLVLFGGGILGSPDPTFRQRNAVFDLVHKDRIDGIIVLSPIANHIGIEGLSAFCWRFAEIPLVTLGVEIPGRPSVRVDDAHGMRQVIEHMIVAHGKRRLAFLRGPVGNAEAQGRYDAYRETLKQHGIAFDASLVWMGDFSMRSGFAAVKMLRGDQSVEFDALIGANDQMALGAIEALQLLGLDVPGKIGVTGFDDIEEAHFATPALTTVRQSIDESARHAVRILVEMIRGRRVPFQPTFLETQLVLRESCGCTADAATDGQGPPTFFEVTSVDTFVSAERGRIVAALEASIPPERARIPSGWGHALHEAFLADIAAGSGARFTTALGATLQRAMAEGGSVRPWHAAISALQKTVACIDGDPRGAARAREVLHGARVLIGDKGEAVQGQHRIARERWMRRLDETSAALAGALGEDAIVEAVAGQMRRWDIPSCAMSVYDGPEGRASRFARSLFVYDEGKRVDLPGGGGRFPAHQLVACEGGWRGRPRTLVVEPLALGGEQFGFIVFEMGPTEGEVYEGFRKLISSAMKGTRLVEQVVQEATRRQRAERDRLDREMEIAVRIQTSLSPTDIAVPGLEIAAAMLPATEVGGDYYDVIPFDGGCWIGIGDVAGHGLFTGLVMLIIQSAVSALVRDRPQPSPRDVIRTLNAVMFESVRQRMQQDEHATLSIVRYDGGGHFALAGAHEEALVYRKATGRCERHEMLGPFLGIVLDLRRIPESVLLLAPGDFIVLYTDGLIEARNDAKIHYGIERVCELIEDVAHLSVGAIRDSLVGGARRWMSQQEDDLSLVVVRRTA